MTQTGIVLQGGGALGAYEWGALTKLYEDKTFSPHIVAGVSIGAITAAVLVGHRTERAIDALDALWDRFALPASLFLPEFLERNASLWGNPHFFRPRLDYQNAASWTNFYDVTPLRKTLLELVDFEKINCSKQKLIVTATNVKTGDIEVFSNQDREQPISVNHIIASGSLPPSFPLTEIAGNYYWDGGLFDNTPLGPVIEAFDNGDAHDKRLIVINLFPAQGEAPTSMSQVFDRVLEIIFANKFHEDVAAVRKVNEYVEVMNAIDKALPKNSPIRKQAAYQRLQKYKLFEDVLYITNQDSETAGGPMDFSQASLAKRRKAGYRDAAKALGNK